MALVVPPAIVVLAANNNSIYKYIIPGTTPTQGSPTGIQVTLTNQQRANFQNSVLTAAVIEVAFIAAFIVTIYYGIKHTHPEH